MFKHVPMFTSADFKRIRVSHQSHIQVLYYKPQKEEGEATGAEGGHPPQANGTEAEQKSVHNNV